MLICHGEQDPPAWHSKVKNKVNLQPTHPTSPTADALLAFLLKSSNYSAAGLCLLPALRGLQSAADTRRPQSPTIHNPHTYTETTATVT